MATRLRQRQESSVYLVVPDSPAYRGQVQLVTDDIFTTDR